MRFFHAHATQQVALHAPEKKIVWRHLLQQSSCNYINIMKKQLKFIYLREECSKHGISFNVSFVEGKNVAGSGDTLQLLKILSINTKKSHKKIDSIYFFVRFF